MSKIPLQWGYNERDGVSNHQPHECLLNRLFRRRYKKKIKAPRLWPCAGNSPVTGGFPAQKASSAENVFIWCRHHVASCNLCDYMSIWFDDVIEGSKLHLVLLLGMVYVSGSHCHDDVIKWKHFPRYCPFVRGIHRSTVNSPHKGQWRGALMFSLIYAWISDWVNNREAGDLRCHHGHYDVMVIVDGIIILVPYFVVMSLEFICRSLTCRCPIFKWVAETWPVVDITPG